MLRDYQQNAIDAIKKDLHIPGSSLIVMPTASGKSHIIAEAAKLSEHVLILQPSRELLAQNHDKLSLIVPKEEIGIYSASFGQRDIKKFTFATIQSVYKKPELFQHIKLVIIDECHGLSPKEIETMYMKFLLAIGQPKTVGLTATPFRLESGYFRHPDGSLEEVTMLKIITRIRIKASKTNFWKRIIYKIDNKDLLARGFVAPIEYIHEPLMPYAEIPVNVSCSDYNLEAYSEAIVGREALILSTIAEAQRRFKSVLVFCPTTELARHLSTVVVGSSLVLGDTPKKERAEIIDGFKKGTIKTVFNVSTLTTGFDKPDLDCIILLRPTRSLPLYNQIIGRGVRIAPGKDKCTVIDLTSTCKALGRMETFEMYQAEYGLWELRTEKHQKWHGKVLFFRGV